jgi:hypothetical protein
MAALVQIGFLYTQCKYIPMSLGYTRTSNLYVRMLYVLRTYIYRHKIPVHTKLSDHQLNVKPQ